MTELAAILGSALKDFFMSSSSVRTIFYSCHFKTKIIHKEALLVQAGAAMDVNEVVHRIFNNNNLNKRELIQSYNNIKVSII